MNTNARPKISRNTIQELIQHFEKAQNKKMQKGGSIKSNSAILADFRKTARTFDGLSNSHPSDGRNPSGYDPNKVKLAREKKVASEPKQTSVNPRQTQKDQIRAGKAYGLQKKSRSGYDPEKVKRQRAERKNRENDSFSNGLGKSKVIEPNSPNEGYNPAKVRALRAKRRSEEDDDRHSPIMRYSTTGRKGNF